MKDVFEKEATVDQWDKDYYHPIAMYLYDKAISDMLRLMEIDLGALVLDAGCGPGLHSLRVAKAGYRVCAIDISETMLRRARQHIEAANINAKVEFYQKDLTKLDFPDASFRYVFSWGVIIHIPEAEKALDELSRVIEPGGKLALSLTNKSALDNKIESFIRFLLRKPLVGIKHLPLGDGIWYEMNKEKLWLWRFDAKAVTAYLLKKGFHLKSRRIGELSEIQMRLRGIPRHMLLHLNNLAYRLNLPPQLACTTLFVFEKERS